MPDLSAIIENGAANPWLYLPVAILLGALHALEPGHSKSLMAAFIIAIRGTSGQAALLGVSAAIGHTIVVWGLALAGFYLGDKLILDKAEPWLIFISGLLIIALAARLALSARAIISRDQPSGHDGHNHSAHDHSEDAHAAAHQHEIESKFAGRKHVSNGEIAWFGFTGGFLPCPSAIAVLLVCLQLKQIGLGIAMVAAFSIGLAATLVAVGLAAAWGTAKAASRFAGLNQWSARLPLISGAFVMVLGLIITLRGMAALGWL
jgi:nickel/cobalt transporter (NicO) family protein